jgi:hypothetical protein
MRDAERTIERLLAGLSDAEPPGGMERRILEALDGMGAREVAVSASLWRRPLRPALAMLLACAVILMVAFTVQQRKHVPGQQVIPLKPHGTPGQAKYGLHGAPNINSSLRVSQEPELAAPDHRVRLPRRTTSDVPAKHSQDAPAVGETQAASFPAPPLPLTEQEKLLLRVAHRRDPENMAILNPDVQAMLSAKATQEFQQFFEINATEMRSESE